MGYKVLDIILSVCKRWSACKVCWTLIPSQRNEQKVLYSLYLNEITLHFIFLRDGSCLETVLDHGADVYGM